MRSGQVVLGCVLCFVATAIFTVTKSALLFLISQKQSVNVQQWYAAVFFVLIVPEVAILLKIVWSSSYLVRAQMTKWPPIKSLLLGTLTTLLESAAVTFFTLEIGPQLPIYVLLPLMNMLLFLQIIVSQWRRRQEMFLADKPESASMGSRTLHTIAAIFGICAFFVMSALLVILDITNIAVCVSLLATIMTLSVAWCQPLRVYMFQADALSLATRQNTCLVYTLLRIVSVGGFVILMIPLHGEISVTDAPVYLWNGVTILGQNKVLVYTISITICCGFLAYGITRISSFYTTTWSGICVPVVVSTMLSSVIHGFNCLEGRFLTLHESVCPLGDGSLVIAGLVVMLWILPVLILRKNFFHPPDILFKPEHENFITPGYNSIFFDQHLYLHYYPNCRDYSQITMASNGRSRVFMCTTMYRESDYEMEQLLRSLAKISKSKRLKTHNIYTESHIFLDNGADGLTLKEFALQLMALVQTCLSVGRSDGSIHHTPYGIQISCTLPGNMPLFLHLKDPSHVKAKKRWSQVMYMNYIMDHRINVTNNMDDMQSHMLTLKRKQMKPCRNTEIILQIKTLLANLQYDDDGFERSSINSKCESVGSSDQGIETGDDMSAVSEDVSSSKRSTLQVPDYSESKYLYSPSTASSCTNLLPSDDISGKTTPSLSKSSSQMDLRGQDDRASSCQSVAGSTYAAFISDFPAAKLNPAYIPEDNEVPPPTWLSQFMSQSKSTCNIPSFSHIHSLTKDGGKLNFGADDIILNGKDATTLDVSNIQRYDDRTYILATDADMHFNDKSVLDLVNTCNNDLRLGAACGRTHPMGKKLHPIVGFQKFEYAKDFWLIKSAQNIIGSVMCCPGCFSLYRVTALQEVIPIYSEPTTKAGDVFTKDTGEDRWMCTLMMLRGWKLGYSNFSYNGTYCPDSFDEFIKQRRRWILSDFANSLMVFRNLPQLVRQNSCFSFVYILYLLQLFIIVFLSPGSTVVMMTVGLDMLLGLAFYISTPIVSALLILYGVFCMRMSSQSQILLTKVTMMVLGVVMSVVVIGAAVFVVRDVITDIRLQEHYILITLTGSLLFAAMLHPHECWLLICGIFYLFFFPAMHMLLPVYALCNIVDQTWGTRENQKAKKPKFLCFPKLRFKQKKKKKAKQAKDSDACVLDEDSEVTCDQLKDMRHEEQTFWTQLVQDLVGKDTNLGLNKHDLEAGLHKLRLKAVLAICIVNIAWVVGLGFFYNSAVSRDSSLNGYGIMNGILYGFSFLIQVVGMTVFRVQDCAHRLGKHIFKNDKPHWITRT
ncbi:uncharacterized protein LOC121380520 [Gigantopelta aegis]|uniref:uncharacterized protein LOC121380520 n=1 Tax=Gigantopelta aegis TaxID=1735272 RepID=UPI001B887C8C|nr:uncharacterized protein LOC121380520 [Gigantopelta aegis]